MIDNVYRVERFLGEGGMATVYAVRHLHLDRVFALKLLDSRACTANAWARFQNEGRSIARLDHPGIVKVYNLGIDNGVNPYIAMELLEGRSLHDYLQDIQCFNLEETIEIMLRAASALSFAHGHGLVHRDIKPANLVLSNFDESAELSEAARIQVKVVDFGIVKLTQQQEGGQALTAEGEVLGSPFYMSPEQLTGGQVDNRTDIYALGCTMFELLTGEPPFRGRKFSETAMLHIEAPIPYIQGDSFQSLQFKHKKPKQIVEALNDCLELCLAKDPDDRFSDMHAFARSLQELKKLMQKHALAAQDPGSAPIEVDDEELRQAVAKDKMRKMAVLVVAIALVLGGIGCGIYAWDRYNASKVAAAEHKAKLKSPSARGEYVSGMLTFSDAGTKAAVDRFVQVPDADKIANLPPYKSAVVPKSFLHAETIKGKPYLFVNFPMLIAGGYFIVLHPDGNRNFISSNKPGRYAFPPGSRLIYYTGSSMCKQPELLRGLDGALINSVHIFPSYSMQQVLTGNHEPLNDKIFAAMLEGVKGWPNLKQLAIDCDTISPAVIKKLGAFKQIRSLELHGCYDFKSTDFDFLRNMDALHAFKGSGSDVDLLWKAAKQIESLDKIQFFGGRGSGATILQMVSDPRLRFLRIDGCAMADVVPDSPEIKARLQKLKPFDVLCIDGMPQTGERLAPVAWRGCKHLVVSRMHQLPAWVRHCRALQTLGFEGNFTLFSDNVPNLAIPGLKRIEIEGSMQTSMLDKFADVPNLQEIAIGQQYIVMDTIRSVSFNKKYRPRPVYASLVPDERLDQ
jgi:hypothetical protein